MVGTAHSLLHVCHMTAAVSTEPLNSLCINYISSSSFPSLLTLHSGSHLLTTCDHLLFCSYMSLCALVQSAHKIWTTAGHLADYIQHCYLRTCDCCLWETVRLYEHRSATWWHKDWEMNLTVGGHAVAWHLHQALWNSVQKNTINGSRLSFGNKKWHLLAQPWIQVSGCYMQGNFKFLKLINIPWNLIYIDYTQYAHFVQYQINH
jgi:hypothetical protein